MKVKSPLPHELVMSFWKKFWYHNWNSWTLLGRLSQKFNNKNPGQCQPGRKILEECLWGIRKANTFEPRCNFSWQSVVSIRLESIRRSSRIDSRVLRPFGLHCPVALIDPCDLNSGSFDPFPIQFYSLRSYLMGFQFYMGRIYPCQENRGNSDFRTRSQLMGWSSGTAVRHRFHYRSHIERDYKIV